MEKDRRKAVFLLIPKPSFLPMQGLPDRATLRSKATREGPTRYTLSASRGLHPCKGIRMDREIKVLIVDGQHRSRQSLQALLATWPAVAAIREAANGIEAQRLAEEYRPDLVLIDVRMPEMGGL